MSRGMRTQPKPGTMQSFSRRWSESAFSSSRFVGSLSLTRSADLRFFTLICTKPLVLSIEGVYCTATQSLSYFFWSLSLKGTAFVTEIRVMVPFFSEPRQETFVTGMVICANPYSMSRGKSEVGDGLPKSTFHQLP